MAKKVAKQPALLRIRLDPKLVARLEKAREANGFTLTGEIESRLEESFQTADKIALIREQLEDLRRRNDEAEAALEADKEKFAEEGRRREKSIEEIRDQYRAIQSKYAHLETAADMVDVLLGNEASSALVRRIVGALAGSPDWSSNAEATKEMTLKIEQLVKAAPHVALWGGTVSAISGTISARLPASGDNALSISTDDQTADSQGGEKNESGASSLPRR